MKIQQQLQYKVWHEEAVIHRFIEAAHVQRLVPMRFGPRAGGSAWPQVTHDWSDLVAQAGAEEDETDRMVGMLRSVSIPPAALTRLDEVYDWHLRFLKHKPGAARCLWVFMIARVTPRWTFASACRRRGWAKRTAYRRVSQAIDTVVAGLNEQAVPYSPADPDIIANYVDGREPSGGGRAA
jgi:hypothetical protein